MNFSPNRSHYSSPDNIQRWISVSYSAMAMNPKWCRQFPDAHHVLFDCLDAPCSIPAGYALFVDRPGF